MSCGDYVVKSISSKNKQCAINDFTFHEKVFEIDSSLVPRPIREISSTGKHYFIYEKFGDDLSTEPNLCLDCVQMNLEKLFEVLSENGIAHNDYHLGNILVNENNEFRITDFELANETQEARDMNINGLE